MPDNFVVGSFAHVVGSFVLSPPSGTIDFVTPVGKAARTLGGGEKRVRLVGRDRNETRTLFDLAVNPQRNSEAPSENAGTYEEYVPVTSDLYVLRLMVTNEPVAEYRRGRITHDPFMAFGAPSEATPHRVPLEVDAAPSAGVTYIVQARPNTAEVWQTLAVGLETPSAEIDVNQFPGSSRIEVRVLRSDGFAENEVFRQMRTLG